MNPIFFAMWACWWMAPVFQFDLMLPPITQKTESPR